MTEQEKKNNIFNSEDIKEGDSKKKLSVSEMYAILTLSMNFPPDYVLDRMEMYEVRTAFKYQYYSVKDDWEQARLIAYMTAAVNSSKKLESMGNRYIFFCFYHP